MDAPRTRDHALDLARRLKSILKKDHNITVPPSLCREAIARGFGRTNWHDFDKHLSGGGAVAWNERTAAAHLESEVPGALAALRRLAALESAGSSTPTSPGAGPLDEALTKDLLSFIGPKIGSSRRRDLDSVTRGYVRTVLANPRRQGSAGFRLGTGSVDDFLRQEQPRYAYSLLPRGAPALGSFVERWVAGAGPLETETGWQAIARFVAAECEARVGSLLLSSRSPFAWGPPDPEDELRQRLFAAVSAGTVAEDGPERRKVVNTVLELLSGAHVWDSLVAESLSQLKRSVGSRPLLELFVVPRNEFGFYRYRPGIERDDEYWRPMRSDDGSPQGKRDHRTFSAVVDEATVTIDITRERSALDYEEGGAPVAFYFFLAKAVVRDQVVGVVRGELLLDRTALQLNDWDFYSAAENLTGDLTSMAHCILADHMEASEFFENGDVLYLTAWEVCETHRRRGFAKRLLEVVFKELRRRHRRLASVVYEVKPAQFDYPIDLNWPAEVVQTYREARASLAKHLRDIGFSAIWPGSVIEFEESKEQAEMTDNERAVFHVRR